ncbi:hypothetical protein R1sor_022215 [Riccia sorocarpa]|uniref:E2F-associated phosphoprotein n=1 Tax=Riccia sorocarpa TaxID=122646 RepID=A0ABD3GLF5_9MARC
MAAAAAAAAAVGAAMSMANNDDNVMKAMGSTKYYDEKLDDQDEAWAIKQRQGRKSDAILSCPACFTTLCIDCQRHEQYVHQYRAMFVRNCRVVHDEILRLPAERLTKRTRKSRKKKLLSGSGSSAPDEPEQEGNQPQDEIFKPVRCVVCETEVALQDSDEVFHFHNVIPSYS